jgi:hypothetical protein
MTYFFSLVFIFLVFWRPQEWLMPWAFGWPILDVITYAALLSLVVEIGQQSVPMPKTPAIMLAVGLWFATVMSHVPHTYFQGIINTIPETFKLCFFLILLVMVINSVRRLQGVIVVLLLGAILMAIHAIMQDRTGAGFAGYPPLQYFYKERWVQQSRFFGIFDDPNDLGQFLATCIPLAFAVPKRLSFISVILGLGVIWLLAAGMLTTESRGTMVGVVAAVCCLLFLALPTRWMPYLAAFAVVGGLIACGVFGRVMLDESARGRLTYWGFANTYFKSHLLFGGGYGMFGQITGTWRASHNAFVLCYTELGLFGYWFWFNLMAMGVIGCWRTRLAFRRPRTPEQAYLKRVSGLAIVTMTGFAASSYFLSRAFIFPLFFLFAVLASIPVVAQRYLPEEHPPLVNMQKDVFFTGTVLSLLSVAYIYASILILNRGR